MIRGPGKVQYFIHISAKISILFHPLHVYIDLLKCWLNITALDQNPNSDNSGPHLPNVLTRKHVFHPKPSGLGDNTKAYMKEGYRVYERLQECNGSLDRIFPPSLRLPAFSWSWDFNNCNLLISKLHHPIDYPYYSLHFSTSLECIFKFVPQVLTNTAKK